MFWSVGWPLLRSEGFFCNLDVLYGGLGIGKLYFLMQKKCNFFFICNFFKFFVINRSVFSLKCWIRIRMKLMRIRNPTPLPLPPLAIFGYRSGVSAQCKSESISPNWFYLFLNVCLFGTQVRLALMERPNLSFLSWLNQVNPPPTNQQFFSSVFGYRSGWSGECKS